MGRLLVCMSVAVALWSATVVSMSVFSSGPEAHAVLRSKRANSWLEELKPASLERECMEEVCDYEEAREIFHTREATDRYEAFQIYHGPGNTAVKWKFWTSYKDGNQCSSHKCVNGVCVDGFQAYECSCNPGYEGKYCNQPRTATNCSEDNGKCHHECTENAGGTARTCSCVGGYRLHDDGKSCIPTGRSSCGQLLIARSSYSGPIQGLQPWVMGGEVGKKGESPWQVLLLNNRGEFHCGGVLINENWVLTAAHCLKNILHFSVRLGDYERFKVEGTEVTLAVVHFVGHPAYNPNTADNDIALMRLATPAPTSNYIAPACLPPRALAERVLHLNGTVTVVTGWGKDRQGDEAHFSSALNVIKVPLVERAMCVQHMEVNVTENMLCAGALGSDADACDGDSGGPMVTRYRDTWFLLGLVSWGEGCGRPDKLGVYTKVANYNGWIEGVQQDWDRKHRPQV